MSRSAPLSGGLVFALGAAAAYGFNITFARIASQVGVQGPSLVTYRVVLMLALAVAVALALRAFPAVEPSERRPMLVLGLASAAVGLCYISSVAFIPVTVAAVLFYTFPILIVLVSPVVDGGRLTPPLLAIVGAAFVGVVLVVGPAFSDLDPIGLALAAGASVSAAVQFFAATRCPRTTTLSKLFWIQAIVLPASLLAALATGGLASPAVLALAPWSVFFNLAGFLVGFILQMLALTRISASAAGLAFCLEPVVAVLTAAAVLGEALSPLQYAGGALVVGAIVANVLRDRIRRPIPARTGAAA